LLPTINREIVEKPLPNPSPRERGFKNQNLKVSPIGGDLEGLIKRPHDFTYNFKLIRKQLVFVCVKQASAGTVRTGNNNVYP
jgi:hypothetical protein